MPCITWAPPWLRSQSSWCRAMATASFRCLFFFFFSHPLLLVQMLKFFHPKTERTSGKAGLAELVSTMVLSYTVLTVATVEAPRRLVGTKRRKFGTGNKVMEDQLKNGKSTNSQQRFHIHVFLTSINTEKHG